MINGPVVIIPAPTEPVSVDLTAQSLKVFFPIALIWCLAGITYCLFANGWL